MHKGETWVLDHDFSSSTVLSANYVILWSCLSPWVYTSYVSPQQREMEISRGHLTDACLSLNNTYTWPEYTHTNGRSGNVEKIDVCVCVCLCGYKDAYEGGGERKNPSQFIYPFSWREEKMTRGLVYKRRHCYWREKSLFFLSLS